MREAWKQHLQDAADEPNGKAKDSPVTGGVLENPAEEDKPAKEEKKEKVEQSKPQEPHHNHEHHKHHDPHRLHATGVLGHLHLPEYKEPFRNQAIKNFSNEFASGEVLSDLKEFDPENRYLEPENLSELIISIEKEIRDRQKDKDKYVQFVLGRLLLLKRPHGKELKRAILTENVSVLDFVTKEIKDLESEETKKKLEEARNWKMSS